jgi:hypothetical protein
MAEIKTLTLNRKKFALLPMRDYMKMLSEIEDLKDLAEIKKRAKEPRVKFSEVKQEFLKKQK